MPIQQYDDILNEVSKELGLDTLSQEAREGLLVKMGEVLMKQIFIETMDRLGEDGAAEYEQFMEGNPEQSAIEDFLNEKIPGYNELIAKIIEDFKKEMKEVIVPQSLETTTEEAAVAQEDKKSIVQDDRITMLN